MITDFTASRRSSDLPSLETGDEPFHNDHDRPDPWISMGDPLLIDPANLDVHLRDGSPCVDAGSDPGSAAPVAEYAHPVDEVPRGVANALWDIVAYEFEKPGLPEAGDTGGTGEPSDTAGPDDTAAACGCAAVPGAGLWAFVMIVGVLPSRRR